MASGIIIEEGVYKDTSATSKEEPVLSPDSVCSRAALALEIPKTDTLEEDNG